MTSITLSCGCANEQQDKIHGIGQRVHNQTAKESPKEFRCTSCSSIKQRGESAQKKKGK